MKVEVTANEITIKIERINPPQLSKSGKSHLVASSAGIVETDAVIDGKKVQVGVNCFIK